MPAKLLNLVIVTFLSIVGTPAHGVKRVVEGTEERAIHKPVLVQANSARVTNMAGRTRELEALVEKLSEKIEAMSIATINQKSSLPNSASKRAESQDENQSHLARIARLENRLKLEKLQRELNESMLRHQLEMGQLKLEAERMKRKLEAVTQVENTDRQSMPVQPASAISSIPPSRVTKSHRSKVSPPVSMSPVITQLPPIKIHRSRPPLCPRCGKWHW